MVVMKGVNDDEVLDFVSYGRENGLVVRFIEFMPLDADETWTESKVMPQNEILELISSKYDLEPLKGKFSSR